MKNQCPSCKSAILCFFGILGIIVTVIFGVITSLDITSLCSFFSDPTATKVLIRLSYITIWGFIISGILLSIIVIGIGSIVKRMNKKGETHEKNT